MKIRLFVAAIVAAWWVGVSAQVSGRDSLQVSLLTCGPGTEVYELFGHSALRVRQPGPGGFDYVFNYGMFNFNAPAFVWRFTKGETDYCLGVNDFRDFLFNYVMRESRVDEQVLNLTPEQSEALFAALLENARPENRVYRYNFLFDNCATRPRNMVEATLDNRVRYREPEGVLPTFREEIDRYAERCPWLIFGIDLALGSGLDRPMTYREQMFGPEVLKEAFARAEIQLSPDSAAVPLVSRTEVLYDPETPALPGITPFYLTPLFFAWLLLAVVAGVSVYDIRRGRCSRVFDTVLFTLYGLGGVIIFFLVFVSVHPATSPNYSAFWLHPLWLLVALFIWFKSLKKIVRYYHFANFAGLLIFLLLWHWIPQQFNTAFIPLVLVLILRSFTALWVGRREKSGTEQV
ncbi:DUF4105 domain-containing protein [Barnesiella viscericola]|uniref:lipoprotein N-acyltransferase Lnb domain-containing protein n=1 Tax=Barnesiella viscericola TaxID=397865 RepID=UPI003209C0BD